MANHQEVFSSLRDNLSNVLSIIESTEVQGDRICSGSDLEQYWATFHAYSASFAQSINMLAMSFRSEPFPTPSETADMATKVQAAAVGILQAVLTLSPDSGRRFIQHIRSHASGIISSGLIFVREGLCLQGCLSEADVRLAGTVFERCDVIRVVPRTQALVVHQHVVKQQKLVEDALNELEEARSETTEDDDDFSMSFSEEDLKLLPPGLGLLKTVKALAKKVAQTVKKHGNSGTKAFNQELDELCDVCSGISPCVDEFSASLYPPIDPEAVAEKSRSVIQLSKEIHQHIQDKHYALEVEVSQWSDFLLKALNHNETQLQIGLAGRQLNNLTV